MKPSAILTIAGSDGSSGAGVQSDLLTFHDLKLKGICVITSLVSQTPEQTIAIEKRSAVHIKQELNLLADFYDIQAIKIGLISSVEQLEVIHNFIIQLKILKPQLFIILDPVGIASTGFKMQDSNVDLSLLFSSCDLITPNLFEAEFYMGCLISNLAQLQQAAQFLYTKFNTALLIKGGHLLINTQQIYDVYINSNILHTFTHQSITDLTQWHGTGCKLSSAIAGYVSLNYPLFKSIELAQHKLRNDFYTQ